MKYEIQELEKDKWHGYEIFFCDYADSCYDIKISHKENTFSVTIDKKPLEKRKEIKYPNKLFVTGYADIKAWGIIVDEKLVAVVETAIADKNRLYISELWVDEKYRRQGCAAALIDVAKRRAIDEQQRVIFLETYSCNEHAIEFYLSQGFELIGFDSCPFSNEDVAKFNVPLKFGYYIKNNI